MSVLSNSSAMDIQPYEIPYSTRFNDGGSEYFSRTPGSAGNQKTWTWSGWIKRGSRGASTLTETFYSAGLNSGSFTLIGFTNSGDRFIFYTAVGATNYGYEILEFFRDHSSWHHFCVAYDSTQGTAANRLKIYVNGVLYTNKSADYGDIPLNHETYISSTYEHDVGKYVHVSHYFDGYMSEVHFIDGQALTPSSFGESYGDSWRPIEYTGTHGTQGWHLDFSNSGSLGTDASANTNNWTVNSLAATDQVLDTPTNNFATLNPVDPTRSSVGQSDLSEGNLKSDDSASTAATDGYAHSSIAMTSGKWYVEFLHETWAQINWNYNGVVSTTSWTSVAIRYDGYGGKKAVNGAVSAYGTNQVTGDIVGCACDVDGGTVEFFLNGTSQGQITGLNTSHSYFFTVHDDYGTAKVTNFGQDSSFAGNKTAQGNTDDNGIGDFYYSPPAGFLALCTSNLDAISTPYQAYSSCGTEDEYTQITYVGNGSSDGTFIYLGFLASDICIDGTHYDKTSSSFDFLSNGIKCRSSTVKNVSTTSYTLEAWVAQDLKYANAQEN